jgi:PAS domain S-box-containing protein
MIAEGKHAISLSDKYEEYRTYDVMPTGEGIWGRVIQQKLSFCMTDEELQSHPAWRSFSDLRDERGLEHSPMRGWLAVPVLCPSKKFIGLLQLSDKYEGDFNQDDLQRLTRLAQLMSPTFSMQHAIEELQQLSSAAHVGVAVGIVESQTGRIVHINEKYEDLLGYSNAEATTKTWMEITHIDDVSEDLDKMRDLGARRIVDFSLEKRLIRKDGSMIWVNFTVSPIWTFGEISKQHVVILEDITERKKLEKEAREHRERLAHVTRLNTMGEVATGLAHEINQPLATITNCCYLAEVTLGSAGTMDTERLRELITTSAEQVMRAGKIIERLRRLVENRAPVRSRIDIGESIREVVRMLDLDLRSSEVRVELREDHLPAVAFVDDIQIQQVLMNLLRNALDATRETERDQQTLEISTSRTTDRLIEIAVCDSGTGISGESADHVFDAFYTTKADGMGIGLAISQTIIESHGGRLWLTPNSDCGVTFYFTLPTGVNDGPTV